MAEDSPTQQQGRDSQGDMAAARWDAVEMKIKEARDDMTTVSKIFFTLLKQHREPVPLKKKKHRGRRLTAADELVLRYCEFIHVELSGMVELLNQIYSLPDPLGPDYVDEHFLYWLAICSDLASSTTQYLDTSEQAADCFSRSVRVPLPSPYKLQQVLPYIFRVTESCNGYRHLLLNNDSADCTWRMSTPPTKSHPYSVDASGDVILVGIEETLSRWFMAVDAEPENKTLRVMSMVGSAGVGKTALAMEVYRRLQQIRRGEHRFQCCATAKVFHRPDMIELLKHILSQINKQEAWSESSFQPSQITTLQQEQELLVGKISQYLQDKRYLVVIDDIREESDWYIIKNAFPQNNLCSRIIVTTQLRSLAQFCSSHSANGLVHEVKPLSRLDSERLLFGNAFGPEDSCSRDNLKQVCDEILRRCEGIPLFITGMADWLREQQELQHISTNYSMEIIPKLPKQIQQALGNACYDLPCSSKALLIYMGLFQEGHMFEMDSFVLKWMCAQGELTAYDMRSNRRLFPVAKRCLSELIDRNMITSVRGDIHQVEGDCLWQVSYFMQQFLASKSADVGFASTSSTLASVPAQGDKKLARQLYLHQPDPQLPMLLGEMDLSHTRSLAISGEVDGVSLDKFTHLAVLDLEGWQCLKDEDMLRICKMFLLQYLILKKTTGISKLPPEIKELQLLSTLDISHTSISELPPQVCELKFLETLDLRRTRVRQLPEQLWGRVRLRHLLVSCDKIVTEIQEGIRRAEYLSTLATVDLSGCPPSLVEAFGEIRLRVLAITWSFNQCSDRRFQKALRSCLGIWLRLESLTILCGLGCCMDFLDYLPPDLVKFKVTQGRFGRIPPWFHTLHNLTFMEITVCRLDPEDLSILRNLPGLERLVLGLHFIPEAAIVIGEIGFDRLERFSVSCRVPWLTFNEGAMQELTFLQLKIAGSPASPESVPSGIDNLKSLSEVAIRYHANYTNSPNVKRTVEVLRKGVSKHRMLVNLFINGIKDEEEDVEAARESTSQNEIEVEE